MVTKIFILQLANAELPIPNQHLPHQGAVVNLIVLKLKGQLHEIEIEGSNGRILS